MADLVVDYPLLDQTETSLSGLAREFGDIKSQERSYDGDWGSPRIENAMTDFAGNWDEHRTNLLGKINTLGQHVRESKKGFQGTDTKLKSQLTKKAR
jgi:hypothetical protein